MKEYAPSLIFARKLPTSLAKYVSSVDIKTRYIGREFGAQPRCSFPTLLFSRLNHPHPRPPRRFSMQCPSPTRLQLPPRWGDSS